MNEGGRHQFLIDGFPRNKENQKSFFEYVSTSAVDEKDFESRPTWTAISF